MKICIVIDDYLPESIKVAAKMMHDLAVEFRSRNHQVTVITPGIGFREAYTSQIVDGVNVLKFPSGEIKNVSKIKRLINELLLSRRAWLSLEKFFSENKHDCIIYYSPSIFWSGLIFKLKRLWGVPSYLILRDLFPQWVIDSGIIGKNSPLAFFFRYFEKLNYKAADRIGIQSPENLKWFASNRPSFKNTHVLFNWASIRQVKKSTDKYRKQLGIEDKIVYFYGGNIGQAQDMMNLIRLAKRMKIHAEVHFVLVGAGDEVDLVRKAIQIENLHNVSLLDPVSQAEYEEMLGEFDVGLFTLNPLHKTHNFPGKILGYMAQEKPILGSVNKGNDLEGIVHDANAGLISLSGDDDKFYENARSLLNRRYRMELGKNGRELLDSTFSTGSAADKILNSLNGATAPI